MSRHRARAGGRDEPPARPLRRVLAGDPAGRPYHGQGGFMLLEVLLAAALLGIGLFAIVSSLGRCVAAARAVQNQTIAENLLANKSFEFRVERPTDDLDDSGNFDDYPTYTWARTLETTDIEGLFKQTITVYWQERGALSYDALTEYRYLPEKAR